MYLCVCVTVASRFHGSQLKVLMTCSETERMDDEGLQRVTTLREQSREYPA